MNYVRYGAWCFRDCCVVIYGTAFPVCSFSNPIAGRYLLSRKTEGWQLAPVIYQNDGYGRKVKDMPFYTLTYSPEAVDAEINRALTAIR